MKLWYNKLTILMFAFLCSCQWNHDNSIQCGPYHISHKEGLVQGCIDGTGKLLGIFILMLIVIFFFLTILSLLKYLRKP